MQFKVDSCRCSADAKSLHEESGQPSYRSTNFYLRALNCQDTAEQLPSLPPAPALLSQHGFSTRDASGVETLSGMLQELL